MSGLHLYEPNRKFASEALDCRRRRVWNNDTRGDGKRTSAAGDRLQIRFQVRAFGSEPERESVPEARGQESRVEKELALSPSGMKTG
jgi:hypothetical protein